MPESKRPTRRRFNPADYPKYEMLDRVLVRDFDNQVGRIVMVHGPDGPDGIDVYRVEFPMDPTPPKKIDLCADQLEFVAKGDPSEPLPAWMRE